MSGSALIGALRVMLGLESASFTEGLTAAQVRLKAFDAKVKGIGAGMAKVGAGISIAGAGLAAAIRSQINAADDMSKMSAKFGVPVETLSRLGHAAELSDVSLDLLGTSLAQLSKRMEEAARGGKAGKLFDEVGISVVDASGKLRSTEDVLADVSDVLSKLPPGAQRTAMAMRLLGKSGAQMLPMLQGGSESLREMAAEAEAMGLVITADTATAAESFNDNLTRLQAVLRGVTMVITANLAPVLERLSAWLVDAAKAFQSLSPATQSWITAIAAGTVVLGPALIAIGAVVGSLGTLATAFRAVALAVLGNPIGIVIAGIAAGAYLIWQNWEPLAAGFAQLWGGIKTAALTAWEGIKSAWNSATGFFTKLGSDIAAAAKSGWGQMISEAAAAWESIKAAASTAWDAVKATITGALDAAIGKVQSLIQWFTDAWNAVKGIGQAIADAITGADDLNTRMEKDRQKWVEFGRQSSAGMIEGFKAGSPEAKAGINSYLDGLEETAKHRLEINSPSRVFARIGQFVMQGLGLGIEQGTAGVTAKMAEAGKGVAEAGKAAFGTGGLFGGITDSIGGLGETSGAVFDRMGRWMVDLAKGATSLGQTLRNLASSWSSSIGQSVLSDISGVLTGSFGKVGGGLLSGIVGGLLGFANGGEFQVGGVGGIDSQIVAFRASPNETVSITKPGQMASAGAGIALSASELTLTDDGRIMAVVRAEMVQTGKAAAGAGAAKARADFTDIRRRAKDRF